MSKFSKILGHTALDLDHIHIKYVYHDQNICVLDPDIFDTHFYR